MHELFDLRMADGSRHFGDLPESYDANRPQWDDIKAHVARLSGAVLTSFVTDEVTEAWIEFRFADHAFSINNQQGWWWFFVKDASCPDRVLQQVLDHFEQILDPRASVARSFGALATGHYRVLVYEQDGRVSFKDFGEQNAAREYADDAASEDALILAYVFDADFRVLYTGQHYAMRR